MTTPPPGPRHGPRQPYTPQPEQQRQPEQWRRPEPPQQRPQPPPGPPPRDPTWLFALRVTAYLLTSLASLLSIVLVIYGYLAVQDLRDSLSSNPLFGGSSYSAPTVPSQGDLCVTNPDAPECTEGYR